MSESVHQMSEEHNGNHKDIDLGAHINFEETDEGFRMSYDDVGKAILDELMKRKGFKTVDELMTDVIKSIAV